MGIVDEMEDADFERWMREVDGIIGDVIGLSASDLPDFPSRAYFRDGMTPAEACECAAEDWWDMGEDFADMFRDF